MVFFLVFGRAFVWANVCLSFYPAPPLSLHVNQYKLLHLCSHLSRINHRARNTEEIRVFLSRISCSCVSAAAAALGQRNCSYALICTSFDFLVYSALIHSRLLYYSFIVCFLFCLESCCCRWWYFQWEYIDISWWMCVCESVCKRCNTFFICHFGLFFLLFGHFTFAATTSSGRRQKVPPSHRKKHNNPQRHRRCGINFRFSLGFFLSFYLARARGGDVPRYIRFPCCSWVQKSHKIMNQMWNGNEKRRAEKKASQLEKVVEEGRGEGVTKGGSLAVLCNRPCCFRLG